MDNVESLLVANEIDVEGMLSPDGRIEYKGKAIRQDNDLPSRCRGRVL